MPTDDIIGYLARNKQDLSLDSNVDIFEMATDLQRVGLDLIRVNETKIFGTPTGFSVQWVKLTDEEWADLIHSALLDASVAAMLSGGEEQ